jgi:TolB-like protein
VLVPKIAEHSGRVFKSIGDGLLAVTRILRGFSLRKQVLRLWKQEVWYPLVSSEEAGMSERVQRQLSAILAADVAGYSRLIGIDEEGTLARLKELRRNVIDPKIAEHRGRIVKTMGDGLLVQFNSAVDAVRFAAEIQRLITEQQTGTSSERRIEFRMGVNVGDVVIDGDDIHGDGVNVAARLEALSEPSGICVSGVVYEYVRDKLDIVFENIGEQELKNIRRPVRVYKTKFAPTTERVAPAAPDKPSIAVLPFENMSGDPGQDYFADGMVEEIITALSRFRELFVIARNSSFTYKGRAVDVKQVGRDLGVHYVLEGSIRKAGNRVRITGQLVDASTGAHLWADRFDGALEDVFDLQDQVTARVIGEIAPRLEEAEIRRTSSKPTGSLGAYDYFLRGMVGVHQWTREGNTEALSYFRRAIELDPNFAAAYGMAARCYSQRKASGWVTDRIQEIEHTRQLARRAVELGRNDAVALCTAGVALGFVAGEIEDGSAFIDRAIALNPNLAWAWLFSGLTKIWLGQLDMAIDHLSHSMRLSPHDPHVFNMQGGIAAAHFFAGRPAEALKWAEMTLRERPNHLLASAILAATRALNGQEEDAVKAMAHLRQIAPALRLSNLGDPFPLRSQVLASRLSEGLRKGGLPE